MADGGGDGLRYAVIGVGALGKEHARLYAQLRDSTGLNFSGVFDQDASAAERVANQCGTQVFATFEDLMAAADAFSVVTPTRTHFEIASRLLQAGKHVLVEKPMTYDAAQAQSLVQLAHDHGCVLQVGHVERFNPVIHYLQEAAAEPRFIEAHRLSPYPGRSTDVGVVLDLMIHDLDVVLAFVRRPVVSVDAVGVSVLSESEDIANARIRFEGGCVANLTASRISPDRLRKIRVFSGGESPSYISLDYRAQEGYIFRLAGDDADSSSLLTKLLRAKHSSIVSEFAGRKIVREPVPIRKDEPLKLEIESFVECVTRAATPVVSGESAKHALDVAFEICRQIQALDASADPRSPEKAEAKID